MFCFELMYFSIFILADPENAAGYETLFDQIRLVFPTLFRYCHSTEMLNDLKKGFNIDNYFHDVFSKHSICRWFHSSLAGLHNIRPAGRMQLAKPFIAALEMVLYDLKHNLF